ncbi:glycolate oxidase subunit GlcF [Halorhodospira halophila]|uniref:Glycolate oxidase iron-sulfur subunit n=1 Tax=Halorhodospira halophila (strain DSM 244 / SL1) TaxID=349124 RepID=A1WTK5_HALHL|nr:glycolate oxidase subunit GlcF [Halorhodospira halophila]ABM61017.1 protein of unknown function DUF224, cysteine-rich region domain protein [Halorhodospira halophila SL1]MBK1729974.1 glycolate oxidase iron-sulfur subunit [Halorhodospira halophila]
METRIQRNHRDTPAGRDAEEILRKCTHCGFCLATCPTYQLQGDELDSPRGRIYLIKQVLEGQTPGPRTQHHLDRCLTCRACETTCPSGVEYGKLLDLGRELVEEETGRLPSPVRWGLKRIVPRPRLFGAALRAGQLLRPLLPAVLAEKIPARRPARAWPIPRTHPRRVVVLKGCVQPGIAPEINPSTAALLDQLGIETVPTREGCCGALDQHLAEPARARARMRANIDAWYPALADGAEAVVVNASGCGALVKEYGYHLRDDPDYAERARQVAERAIDPVELLEAEAERLRPATGMPRRIAFHSPCSLQHGQRLAGRVEALLQRVGFELTPVTDTHLCCGSAGTYSVLQPKMARQLREQRLAALTAGSPEAIATANIGCLAHLAAKSPVPVCHYVEFLEAD